MEQKYAVQSMTGYGRSEIFIEGKKLVTEIRAVNHRFLDVVIKLPPGWLMFEDAIRRQVKKCLHRGRVDLFLSFANESEQERQLQFDWELFQRYVQIAEKLERDYGVTGKLRIGDLFLRDDLWSVNEVEQDLEQLEKPILQSVQAACQQLVQMRKKEGKILAEDLAARCQTLHAFVEKIKLRAPQVTDYYRKRLEERLADLFTQEKIDQDRLLQEVAILAERMDITEECTRLASHLRQFQDGLYTTGPIGRHLDFLLQEMNREINTIGSKANDQPIRSWVVQSKSEIEKMKEQVQNIE